MTFGEMLIVLAVFSILAIMFMVSSQHALTKARLSRVLYEQKMVVQAINSYEFYNWDLPTEGSGLTALSKPVPYMNEVPVDPFSRDTTRAVEYEYYRYLSPSHAALIVSVGPDGVSDLKRAIAQERQRRTMRTGPEGPETVPWLWLPLMSKEQARQLIAEYSYDPTNGSVSKGDIITVYER